ncbi:hypothetical protein K7432_000646 [Basidiobolus ranarum]|uniref:Uncharacterized protein n=1 Tax=Basidiobolus ranarum TaxID=34480 RepID=A0ABR2X453_9FUNG
MKFSKFFSIFKRKLNTTEEKYTRKSDQTNKYVSPQSQPITAPRDTSTDHFNISSYRMHVLETENQYLYEQNRKLNRELKNARTTNESLKDIVKTKDRQIDSIVEEQREALQKAQIIEESMRLLFLDGDKQTLASKDRKASFKHEDPESLKRFVAAIKSIPSYPQQSKRGHNNIVMPKHSTTQKHKYTKPLLPPLPTITDSEETLGLAIEKEFSVRRSDQYLDLLAVPKNCNGSESDDFGRQLRIMASGF